MAIETLGAALRQINRLFAGGVVAGLSDAQLLDRFLAQSDAGAFEALMARHGPMVLSVCRGIVRDPRDAEDAFQATFLVLVKKAGSIRGRDALGGWLYRVAHRVAIQANAAAARRRVRERQAGEMIAATSTSEPSAPDELMPAIHEEIARLPEKFRLAIVLCDLEGMTQAQAAGELHWSERALRYRLAEGRAGSAPVGSPRPGARRRDAGSRVLARGPGCRAHGMERGDGPGRAGSGQSHDHRRGGLGGGWITHSRGAQDHAVAKAEADFGRTPRGRLDDLGGNGRSDFARRRAPEVNSSRLLSPDTRRQSLRLIPPPNPTRSTRSARSRSTAACSIPMASRSPAPRSTRVTTATLTAIRPTPHPRRKRDAWR